MSAIEQHVRTMQETAPKEWWRFVPCADCNSGRGKECLKGGDAWPERLGRPHVSRYRAGILLWGTFWLLEHNPDDLLTPGRRRAVGADESE